MITSIDATNKLAFLYQHKLSPQIKKICEPIFKNYGIYSFAYNKIFKNSSCLFLTSGFDKCIKKYLELIANRSFQALANHAYIREKGYFLWSKEAISQDVFLSLSYEFNIWHGLTIYKKGLDSTEFFSFAFHKNASEKTNFYINNLFILEEFCAYFKEVAKDIVACSDQSKLAMIQNGVSPTLFLPEKYITPSTDDIFLNFLRKNMLSKKTKVKFSNREFQCITHIAHGKTIKDIARILNISPRTVESYIENVKNKTGLNFKSQLSDLFWNMKTSRSLC